MYNSDLERGSQTGSSYTLCITGQSQYIFLAYKTNEQPTSEQQVHLCKKPNSIECLCNYQWQLARSDPWWCLCPQCTVPQEAHPTLCKRKNRKYNFTIVGFFTQHWRMCEIDTFPFMVHQQSCAPLKELLTYGWLVLPKAKPPKLAELVYTHTPDFTVKVVPNDWKLAHYWSYWAEVTFYQLHILSVYRYRN